MHFRIIIYLLSILLLTHLSYSREVIVFLGASITYGAANKTDKVEKAIREKLGVNWEIRNEAVGGWTSAKLLRELDKILDRHSDAQYFPIHIGGNDVSGRRPFPGGSNNLRNNVEEILKEIIARGKTPILSRLSYRKYRRNFPSERHGSLPYNEEVLDPLIKTHCPDWYDEGNSRGKLDFYNWSKRNKHLLSPDGIHFTGRGYGKIREDFYIDFLFRPLLQLIRNQNAGIETDNAIGADLDFSVSHEGIESSVNVGPASEGSTRSVPVEAVLASPRISHSREITPSEESTQTPEQEISDAPDTTSAGEARFYRNLDDMNQERSFPSQMPNKQKLEQAFSVLSGFLDFFDQRRNLSEAKIRRMRIWIDEYNELGWQPAISQTRSYSSRLFRAYSKLRTYVAQCYLRQIGINPGPLDGILGPKTKAAVREYLQDQDHDGLVRYRMLQKIRRENPRLWVD